MKTILRVITTVGCLCYAAAAMSQDMPVDAANIKGVWEGLTSDGRVVSMDMRDPVSQWLMESSADNKINSTFVVGKVGFSQDGGIHTRGVEVINGRSSGYHVDVRGNGVASSKDGYLRLILSYIYRDEIHDQFQVTLFRAGFFANVCEAIKKARDAGERAKKAGVPQGVFENKTIPLPPRTLQPSGNKDGAVKGGAVRGWR